MEASVIVIAYNEAESIGDCVAAILRQSFTDFELIVVDDGSTDGTADVVARTGDSRVTCLRLEGNRGVAAARNAGLARSSGGYVFFTDADCVPSRNWLSEGMRVLREGRCLAVEGRSFYASARVTLADISFEALQPGHYSTSNIAYTRKALDDAGNFSLRYPLNHEDLDLALRVRRSGEIAFCADMIVVHREEKFTVRGLFRYARRTRDTVRFIKDHPDDYRQTLYWRHLMRFRVLYPRKLLIALCPVLPVFCCSIRSWRDVWLLPFVYASAVYIRFILWKEAVKERIFLL